MRTDVAELQCRLQAYERLRAGDLRELWAGSLEDLAELVVAARSASGLTQRQLADRAGIKPQQVQRYEATRYAGVSIERLQAIMDALAVTFEGRVILSERS
ncbi:MAG: helix-turn-helix domain-containing protein [Dehalococcoidia bacterium]